MSTKEAGPGAAQATDILPVGIEFPTSSCSSAVAWPYSRPGTRTAKLSSVSKILPTGSILGEAIEDNCAWAAGSQVWSDIQAMRDCAPHELGETSGKWFLVGGEGATSL